MLPRRLCGILVVIAALVSAEMPASAQSDQANVAQVQAAIATQRQQYAGLHAANSLDQLMALMDQDAFYAGTLQPQWIKGRDAIRAEKEAYFRRYPVHQLTFSDSTVRVFGDTAIDTGSLRMDMTAPGGKSVISNLRYSMVWVRRPDGWKLVNMTSDRVPAAR